MGQIVGPVLGAAIVDKCVVRVPAACIGWLRVVCTRVHSDLSRGRCCSRRYSFAAATVVYAALVAVCGVALVGAKLHLPANFLAASADPPATSGASGSGGFDSQGNATVTGTSGSA